MTVATDLDLFGVDLSVPMILPDGDSARARFTDPVTSHEAADLSAKHLSEIQVIVYDLIKDSFSGLADFELGAQYAIQAPMYGFPQVLFDTPRRRRSDLTRMGRLVDSGVRRMNDHGRNEVVWVVA